VGATEENEKQNVILY